jgi:hypothetical protein
MNKRKKETSILKKLIMELSKLLKAVKSPNGYWSNKKFPTATPEIKSNATPN